MIDLSSADGIHTATKQKRKAPILYFILCVFSKKGRTKVFALALRDNQIWQ